MPGRKWVQRFLKEHKLSLRKPIVRGRDKAATQGKVEQFEAAFKQLEEVLAAPCDQRNPRRPLPYSAGPDRILNIDESGVQRCTGSSKVIVVTGSRVAATQGSTCKESLILVAVGAASWRKMDSHYIICGGCHSANLAAHADPGSTVLLKKESSMMDGTAWAGLLPQIAATMPGGVTPQHRALLIVDSHGSRLTDEALAAARRVGFDVFVLPGGSTDELQPWDQAAGMTRQQWIALLTAAQRRACASNPDLLKNAFRKCGLWPFNPEAVLGRLRAAVAAAAACQAGATSAEPDAAAAATAQQPEPQQDATSSSQEQEHGEEAEATRKVLAALQQLGTAEAEAAAAVLRGQTVAKPVQKRSKGLRLSGWVTSAAFEAQQAAEAAEKQAQEEEKAAKKATTEAKRAAAAAKKAAAEEQRAQRLAAGQKPRGRPKKSSMPR
ncbi:hypothetical protein ABPG75_003097 [Micractinium tetrahymenae]